MQNLNCINSKTGYFKRTHKMVYYVVYCQMYENIKSIKELHLTSMKPAMAFTSDPLVSFNVDRASYIMTSYLIKGTKVPITQYNLIY